jgi:uncharacterized protein (TIGR03435 family)
VASVKANKTGADWRHSHFEYLPGGGLSAENINLYSYISEAYNLPVQSPRLSGGPQWIHSENYDIQATAEKGSIPPGLSRETRLEKTRLMLQTLLAERFHLVMRRETKEVPVYVLVVGKDGPKMRKAAIDEQDCPDGGENACHELNGGQGRGLHAKAVNMADVVDFVSNWTDRPFLDRTGLKGLYAIESAGWVPLRHRPAPAPGTDPTAEDIAYADPATPTLFMIFERLGLKIEQQKAPVEMFTIDHVERPTEN